jgi:hypothetical protein
VPTGYTADIASGKITTLKEFAYECARGMGALISMRDDPHGTPIPREFKVDSYYEERLQDARKEVERVTSLTLEEATEEAMQAYKDALERWEDRKVRDKATYDRYMSMIEQVEAWDTKAEGIKKFMLEQLRSSVDFDCHPPTFVSKYDPKPILQPPVEFLFAQRKAAIQGLEYAQKAFTDEMNRVSSRNEWLYNLRQSLEDL